MQVKQNFDVNIVWGLVAWLHLTSSSNEQCRVAGMITSLCSKYMTSSYQHGRQITSVSHMQSLGYHDK